MVLLISLTFLLLFLSVLQIFLSYLGYDQLHFFQYKFISALLLLPYPHLHHQVMEAQVQLHLRSKRYHSTPHNSKANGTNSLYSKSFRPSSR